jgi:hypothetical protein
VLLTERGCRPDRKPYELGHCEPVRCQERCDSYNGNERSDYLVHGHLSTDRATWLSKANSGMLHVNHHKQHT